MAWLFQRPKSPFWYIGYRASTGKPAKSTRLRWDDPAQTREANDLLRQANADEAALSRDRDRFSVWVPELIQVRYGKHPANFKAYTNRWKALAAFLTPRKILYPRELTGEAAWLYVLWRTSPAKREGGIRRASRNTALEEVKFLRMLMRHAIAMGFANRNPIDGIRIPWEDPKEKPEIEPDHLPVIMEALKQQPEWMSIMFRIAWHTGCRLSDTRLLLRNVDLHRKLIHFPEPKGRKPFTVPLPPPLIPLFTELKREPLRKYAFDPDCTMHCVSARWIHFFRKLGMNYCFHSTRVSFISRCIRAGIPENVVLRLVNHCGVLVNRLYQRHRVDDLRSAVASIHAHEPDALEIPGAPRPNLEPLPGPDTERQPSPSPHAPPEDNAP